MEKSTFLVNIELTNSDVFEIRKNIIDFIKKRAEESTVSFYRPKDKKSKDGITVGDSCYLGDPEPEKINELLDLLKNVTQTEEGKRDETRLIIPLPI